MHFSVTAPPTIARGDAFVVTVWAHLEAQRHVVVERAREALGGGPVLVQTKGPTKVARGTVLAVRLRVDGLVIKQPEDTVLWEGEVGNATFPVRVPEDAREGARMGAAIIFADGLQIARIDFTLNVAAARSAVAALPVREVRHRTAFASYAHEDQREVGARIHGMQKAVPDLEIFWDVLSLRSGQKWELELWKVVPSRDVFYLFWSKAASRSEWVEKEWKCALQTRGVDYIDPVPLVSPAAIPPPPELAALHFNDWMLAFTRRRKSRSTF